MHLCVEAGIVRALEISAAHRIELPDIARQGVDRVHDAAGYAIGVVGQVGETERGPIEGLPEFGGSVDYRLPGHAVVRIDAQLRETLEELGRRDATLKLEERSKNDSICARSSGLLPGVSEQRLLTAHPLLGIFGARALHGSRGDSAGQSGGQVEGFGEHRLRLANVARRIRVRDVVLQHGQLTVEDAHGAG